MQHGVFGFAINRRQPTIEARDRDEAEHAEVRLKREAYTRKGNASSS